MATQHQKGKEREYERDNKHKGRRRRGGNGENDHWVQQKRMETLYEAWLNMETEEDGEVFSCTWL
jgi:hypothetical protein